MSARPQVSIVLPVHNGAKYLRGAVQSCLKQTHQNLELIVVDDCSTDETPDILKAITDPRLKVIRNKVNQRLPRSLNIGFRAAQGEFLTWTSDDNEYEPNAIELMVRTLTFDPKASFVYADYWALYEDTGQKERVMIPQPLHLAARNTLGACFLYKRQVYETIGDYNPYYEIVEDYDYWIRVSKRFKMVHMDMPLYLYRYHSRSLTTTRRPDQDLMDAILKYRSGYSTLSRLGWTLAYYDQSLSESGLSDVQRKAKMEKTDRMIFGLSPLFFIKYKTLGAVFAVLKTVKKGGK